MASQTLRLRMPNFLPTHNHITLSPPRHLPIISKPKTLSRFPPPKQLPTLTLHNPRHSTHKPISKKISVFASSSSSTIPNYPSTDSPNNPTHSLFTESTLTISTILAIALSVPRFFTTKIYNFTLKLKGICTNPSPEELAAIQTLQQSLVCTVGPLFFAAIKDRPSGYLNTPLTVVAAGMAKWLDIYRGVLMVRVMLSWFPNIPWERQPLSAIRDLCDPYLNLFRNIIPPIFDTLDVSSLLAFAVLGTLASIINDSRRAY